eukprot:CAMPEP_0179096314 /NCGR_PEP_ID=MMETSP0796-20121207/44271_1 /TAXON_ID=73915 /ORGANISM="Pyrodinium bahamense, Strain pbaha01" /LENGTH=57 /DNA_ID=CAMNT_0020794031 /DNA_START=319 /DNA_END=489 /DNA_ORIENTATION=+
MWAALHKAKKLGARPISRAPWCAASAEGPAAIEWKQGRDLVNGRPNPGGGLWPTNGA